MKNCIVILMFVSSFTLLYVNDAQAYGPEVYYAAAAAAPLPMESTKSVARVPKAAADLLYLPVGVLKVGMSILPSVSMADGFNDIGRGLVAPFHVAAAVLQVPFDVLSAAGRVPRNAVNTFVRR